MPPDPRFIFRRRATCSCHSIWLPMLIDAFLFCKFAVTGSAQTSSQQIYLQCLTNFETYAETIWHTSGTIPDSGYVRVRTPHLAKEKMYKTSGRLPYYAESMFPKMEMDEHRADRQKIEARFAELEKQLSDHAKKPAGA
jgi:hypothetical protein